MDKLFYKQNKNHFQLFNDTSSGISYTGKEFNQKFKDIVFVKLTNKDECHNGFQFKTGLNEDTIKFNPSGNCLSGGIYFCEFYKIHKLIKYNQQRMVNLRVITISDDAQVYETCDKFKADKLILGPAFSIWDSYDICDYLVSYKPSLIIHASAALMPPISGLDDLEFV